MIFDIQNYCLYDGPGIRTCVYFKGCPLHCSWCHNPESIKPDPQMAYWRDRCRACGTCVKTCPNHALALSGDRVVRNQDLCKACGRCEEVCPNKAMERIGYRISLDDLMARIETDIPFFEDSNGGVTVTGGEPTLQPQFLFSLLERLRKRGIHACVETCGQFDGKNADRLAAAADLFLFDLKHMDPEAHERGTGAGNKRILQNFSRILERAGMERIIPRIPLIPGFNTDTRSIDSFIAFLESCGYEGPVHLMPYHDWARAKYERIGLESGELKIQHADNFGGDRITAKFKDRGFLVNWGG